MRRQSTKRLTLHRRRDGTIVRRVSVELPGHVHDALSRAIGRAVRPIAARRAITVELAVPLFDRLEYEAGRRRPMRAIVVDALERHLRAARAELAGASMTAVVVAALERFLPRRGPAVDAGSASFGSSIEAAKGSPSPRGRVATVIGRVPADAATPVSAPIEVPIGRRAPGAHHPRGRVARRA